MKAWQFVNTRDRQGTLLILLSFITSNGVLWWFHDTLAKAPDAVIIVVGVAVGGITAMINFHFMNGAHETLASGVPRWINPFEFDTPAERDASLTMWFTFETFGHFLYRFHDDLSKDAILAITVQPFAVWIATIIAFHFKKQKEVSE